MADIHAGATVIFDVAVRTVMVYIHARATSQSLTDVAVRTVRADIHARATSVFDVAIGR